jgi:hypothetical protein
MINRESIFTKRVLIEITYGCITLAPALTSQVTATHVQITQALTIKERD